MKRVQILLVTLAACVATLSLAATADADEPDPALRFADERHPPNGAKTNLFLSGALVTGAFYAPAFASSYLWDESRGASDLRIPIAGPWMKLGKTRLCNADPSAIGCNNFMRVLGAVLLVVDGIGQAGGVGLMLESLFMTTEAPSAETAAPSHPRVQTAGNSPRKSPLAFEAGSVAFSPAPLVGSSNEIGLSFTGSF